MKKAFFFAVLAAVGLILAPTIERNYHILTTDPPLSQMVKNLEEQVVCAKKAGFVFKTPVIRTYKKRESYPHSGIAYINLGVNVIVLAPFASYETLAHELGHIIDSQSGRKGPLFDNIRHLKSQEFANAIRDIILRECKSIKP